MMYCEDLPLPPQFPHDFPLEPGVYVQMYLDAMHGGTVELEVHLENLTENGLKAVIHSGPRWLEQNAKRYERFMRQNGHLPAFGFGLDGTTDTDKTALLPQEKGQIIGGIMQSTGAKFSLLDAEGRNDLASNPSIARDPTKFSEAGALMLGSEIRKLAPRDQGFLLFDQPWFAMQSHGDERSQVLPIDQGGSFKGFPSDEYASFCDGRFTQPYWVNMRTSHPKDAYPFTMKWQSRDWLQHEANLAKLGLVRPRGITIQGYGHKRAPWELVNCLIMWGMDRPIFVWSEPYPSPFTLRCIHAARKIVSLGFTGPLAVADFQRSTNGRLQVDNQAGLSTFLELGV